MAVRVNENNSSLYKIHFIVNLISFPFFYCTFVNRIYLENYESGKRIDD